MRLPLAPGGLREMAVLTVVFGGGAAGLLVAALSGLSWAWPATATCAILWLGGLAFFRDPERTTPSEPGSLVSAADGRVTEVSPLDHHEPIGGPALRIGVFLSVFDVHVNRSPCAGTVRSVTYKPGRFLDARHADSGAMNEANTIVIDPDPPHAGPVVVRQVAGLIARRIVCGVHPGDRVEAGQRIGLIKFGSRTEVIVPGPDAYEPAVQVGDRVFGATTVLARRIAREPSAAGRTESTAAAGR
ncbi:MAG: phosphatidylserine decarboxylase proenzyme [Phycisphaerae bacterium]